LRSPPNRRSPFPDPSNQKQKSDGRISRTSLAPTCWRPFRNRLKKPA
jgi:hypothetical protein